MNHMYIADLHIHSRYSRATSRDCTPEHLDLWARRKGIHILGTGDFTHPGWRQELEDKLRLVARYGQMDLHAQAIAKGLQIAIDINRTKYRNVDLQAVLSRMEEHVKAITG